MKFEKSEKKSWFIKTFASCVLISSLLINGSVFAEANKQKQPVNLDLMFIGAHPDDESGYLSTFGQWNESDGVKTGVITITRGESGGNAVGLEEGPALGYLREKEERKALDLAGIKNIFNLDKVNFYYTVSAPLTEKVWGHDSTLEKVVRVLRTTRPEVIVTMNPSPTPGNHGNHQYAARMAVEAYYAAADPKMFPDQIGKEGLQPWRVKKILYIGADGTSQTGSTCETTFVPTEPTDNVFSVWGGRQSQRYYKTWAQVEREAQREYATQGWAVFNDVSSDPQQLGCDRLTEIDSRVPVTLGNTSPTAVLEGALKPALGGLPLGSEFYLTTDQFNVKRGQPFSVQAHVRLNETKDLKDTAIQLKVPDGWKMVANGGLKNSEKDNESISTFTVTPPVDADTKRVRIKAVLQSGIMSGSTSRVVQVVPEVQGFLEPLPQVSQFKAWTKEAGAPQLDNLIKPVFSIGTEETRDVRVSIVNNATHDESGSVALNLPDGFKAEPADGEYYNLAPGKSTELTFHVSNTNPDLKTSNEGGTNGDYNFTITTISQEGKSVQNAAVNLVPVTTILKADTIPTLDGIESPGEYQDASLDLSRLWEGQPVAPDDASGSAKVMWADDSLYFMIHVKDDKLGTVLPPNDAKRHWRTDSVEITIDPRGNSADTSTTFKAGIFPITDDPQYGNPPAASRDADNHPGSISTTAPGMVVKSIVSYPYNGYTLEVKIPMSDLPAAIDPSHMGLNILIYDSDTKDKTGQSRLGWSTWAGVQGDPYRWGHAVLAGYEPPKDRPIQPAEPIFPQNAARSVDSPQSILQSVWDGVPLAGQPAAKHPPEIKSGPYASKNTISFDLQAEAPGKAHVFIWSNNTSVADKIVNLTRGRSERVTFELNPQTLANVQKDGVVLVSFEDEGGATAALSAGIENNDDIK